MTTKLVQRSTISDQATTIQRLLDLSSKQATKSYTELLAKSISEQKDKLAGLAVSADKKLQKLMVALFNKQFTSSSLSLHGTQLSDVTFPTDILSSRGDNIDFNMLLKSSTTCTWWQAVLIYKEFIATTEVSRVASMYT